MRARGLAAAVAALALGLGAAACGGQEVSNAAPATTPAITVSEDDLAGLTGGDDPALQDRNTDTTPDETSTTPAEGSTGDTSAPAPDTSSQTPAPAAETPAQTPAPDASAGTGDTGGATEEPPAADDGDSGDTGGAGFQDFCDQNPGAC